MSTSKIFVIIGFGLFLLLALSFGIGFLTAREVNPAPIIIEKHLE